MFHDPGSFQPAVRARSRHRRIHARAAGGAALERLFRRSGSVPAVPAWWFPAIPKPHATLPHHERRLSRHQSVVPRVLPRSKSLRRARPFSCWSPRDRRAPSIRPRKVTRSSRTGRQRNFASDSAAVSDQGTGRQEGRIDPLARLSGNDRSLRILFSNGSRWLLFLGFDALGMPVFSARSFGA